MFSWDSFTSSNLLRRGTLPSLTFLFFSSWLSPADAQKNSAGSSALTQKKGEKARPSAPASQAHTPSTPRPPDKFWRAALRASPDAGGLPSFTGLPWYDLSVSLQPKLGRFSVKQKLHWTNPEKAALRTLVLRLDANVPGLLSQKDAPSPDLSLLPIQWKGGDCSPHPCSFQFSGDELTIQLSTPLTPHSSIEVNLELEGALETLLPSSALSQLFSQKQEDSAQGYGLLAKTEQTLTLAHFFATLARRENGTWRKDTLSTIGDWGNDSLSLISAEIQAPAPIQIITNGQELSSTVELHGAGEGEHLRTTRVRAALVREFVILGGPWQHSEQKVNGVTLRSHYLPEHRTAGLHSLDAAAQSFRVFEKHFGSYPYPYLEIVEAPLSGGAGGVEFSGLILIGQDLYQNSPLPAELAPFLSSFLSGAEQSAALTQWTKNMREFVTAHEVAHQWWHVLIGSDSRHHPVQDEALTQYSTVFYLEQRYGKERAEQEMKMNFQMGYQMMRMLGEPDLPAAQKTHEFTSSLAYGGLVYGKAPYVYHELRKALGDAAFLKGLRTYSSRYRFRLAPERALFHIWAEQAPQVPVLKIMRRWLDEAHGDEDLGKQDWLGMIQMWMGGSGQPEPNQQAPSPPSFPSQLAPLFDVWKNFGEGL